MANIAVFGGANIDIKAHTAAAHIPATSNPGQVSLSHGGVGRNIAVNLAVLRNEVKFVTAVGDDQQGADVLAGLKAVGVDVALSIRARGRTGSYCAITDDKGELVTAVSSMAVMEQLTPAVIKNCIGAINEASLVVADCNLPSESLVSLAALCGERLIIEPVSVAKCVKLVEVLRNGSLLGATPNLAQTNALTRLGGSTVQIPALHAMGLRNVMLMAGPDGAYASDGKTIHHVKPSLGHNIVDVTGAGDAAVAGFVHGFAHGLSIGQACDLGQQLAGRVAASSHSALE